jgi:ankyrin repeat protein
MLKVKSEDLNYYCCRGDEFNIRHYLVMNPEAIDQISSTSGRTPLIEAVATGNIKIVKILCQEFYCNVNKYSLLGKTTALHLAVELGFRHIATFLLISGAEVNCTDKRGCTPLHLVNTLSMAKTIQRFGGNPLLKSKEGLTPFGHYLEYSSEIRKTLEIFLSNWEYACQLQRVRLQ